MAGRAAPVLTVSDIVVRKQKRTILDIKDLSVTEGEVLAVIGPNGAGKSTLLSVLACLESPTQGKVFYRGQEINRKNAIAARRKMAVVFQEPLLLDGSAADNVSLGRKLRDMDGDHLQESLAWMQKFGIAALADQASHTLSGGEAQRVSLARAFALEPEVLLMDEPFSAVDVISRQSLIEHFRAVLKDSQVTTVLVTHDFSEVAQLATGVVVLDNGHMDALGTPDEIASHPKWRILANASSPAAASR